eukprot:COSAG02_NODE_23131_length_729_cov_0.977778_2_plen_48_part_01
MQAARTLSTYMTQEPESYDLVAVGRYDSKNRNKKPEDLHHLRGEGRVA